MNIWLLFCLDIQIEKIVSFDLIPGFAYPRRNNETAWSWLQIGVKNLLFEDRFFVQPIVQLAEKCFVKRLMKCGKRNWYVLTPKFGNPAISGKFCAIEVVILKTSLFFVWILPIFWMLMLAAVYNVKHHLNGCMLESLSIFGKQHLATHLTAHVFYEIFVSKS